MNNQLKFHIDSQKAFDVNKTSQQMNQDNYAQFVAGGKNQYAEAYS